MATYLVGRCPECMAINAAAIKMDFDTEKSWRTTREEFEASNLMVSELITGERVTIEGCEDGCNIGEDRKIKNGWEERTLQYSYSDNEETFYGTADSRIDAISGALDDYPDADTIWIGEAKKKTIGDYFHQCHVENLFEQLAEAAGEECGECAEDWLEGPRCPRSNPPLPKEELKAKHEAFRIKRKEWTASLVDDIRAALEKWANENDEQPGFWHIDEIEEFPRDVAEKIVAGLLT